VDATTLGSVLALTGVLSGAVVAFFGKRGENAITGYTALTGDLREERIEHKAERAEWKAERAELTAEITRLRSLIIQLGGQP